MIEVKAARLEDALAFAENAEELDKLQMTDLELLVTLREGIRTSERAVTVWLDGAPVALFGIKRESVLGEGMLWMIKTRGTPGKLKKTFFKMSKQIVEQAREFCGVLYGTVSVQNCNSVRWMEALGFVVTKEYHLGKHPFYLMELKRGD